ncbi:hypothetical protein LVJ94_09865 [Pendulispora rubella]|uniref:Lipoprotein n=1 Tax=Pendulispora rubella TaxID=2741070 RepID=A0ABZ2L9D1_9BACT
MRLGLGICGLLLIACGAHPQDDASRESPLSGAASACDFYASSVEAERPCGVDGYALGYGEKYCHRFMNQVGLSERGIAWRDATMRCLQGEFLEASRTNASCSSLTDAAFASHPVCYTQTEHSICALPMSDVWTILRTLDGSDTFSLRGAKQIRSVMATCLQ